MLLLSCKALILSLFFLKKLLKSVCGLVGLNKFLFQFCDTRSHFIIFLFVDFHQLGFLMESFLSVFILYPHGIELKLQCFNLLFHILLRAVSFVLCHLKLRVENVDRGFILFTF